MRPNICRSPRRGRRNKSPFSSQKLTYSDKLLNSFQERRPPSPGSPTNAFVRWGGGRGGGTAGTWTSLSTLLSKPIKPSPNQSSHVETSQRVAPVRSTASPHRAVGATQVSPAIHRWGSSPQPTGVPSGRRKFFLLPAHNKVTIASFLNIKRLFGSNELWLNFSLSQNRGLVSRLIPSGQPLSERRHNFFLIPSCNTAPQIRKEIPIIGSSE